MAASGQTYVLHQRRELLLEKKKVASARLLCWKNFDSMVVDQVKMATDKDVSTELLKVKLSTALLSRLTVIPGGTAVKEQFGLPPDGEYRMPLEVEFTTTLTIGQPLTPRLGESCVA